MADTELEEAIQKLNHFSTEMLVWKAEVSNELRWFRYLLGAILVALIGQYLV